MLEPLEVEIRTLHAILGSERDPDGRAFAPLADAYRRAGQPRKAFGLLTDGLARLPDFASGHVVAARLYAEQGLFEEGEIAARQALELDPENVSALAVLVRVLDGTGRGAEAEEAFTTLEGLEPEVIEEEGVTRPEPVVDVGALAPEDEAVADVATLAPDDEATLDVGELAPDDGAIDITALAPEPEDPVLDVASLAPESREDEDDGVLDVAALAPEPEDAVLDVAALAPEDEPVMAVDMLAPDEEEALDVADLAPDDDGAEVLDVDALAPDDPEEVVSSPAPEPDEPVLDVAALAPEPDDPRPEPAASARDGETPNPGPREGSTPRIYTRTLGELYAKQGFLDRAIEVFRQLQAENPEDEALAARLRELEGRADGTEKTGSSGTGVPAPGATVSEAAEEGERARARDEELEALARDLAEHRERQPEIDTPFAWTGSEEGGEGSDDAGDLDEGPSIGAYFQELLSYKPRGGDA